MAHMPELVHIQKKNTHYLLHLVDCVLDYGPPSALSAERCESFNSLVRLQNIYGNKLAPSRDIANYFAVVDHICYICEGGLFTQMNNVAVGCASCIQDKCSSTFLQLCPHEAFK